MSDSSKNQPIFHINKVGNINSSDVTIQGDQIGIQHNHSPATEQNNRDRPKTRTILFLAASPADRPRLRLDEEAHIITQALQRSNYGDRFQLEQHWAVRPEDLHFLLPKFQPQILYFCCHGEGDKGIVLDDGNGKAQLVATEALADHLSRFPTVECVVLNSCYSDKQAEAIVQHIPYVIGMNSAIFDRAALKFAQGFYNALGADLTYEAAYQNGKDAIALENIPQSQIPILKQKFKND
ncbi:MAG: CHAT domain-containing protein [Oscillatoriophycideae cyanobacterium NC_groundwater_1537_Pr4_S-0.65um_50_18]|nr:CHAT domain-containing protein [Oscillatoriophycideae cyanobacterium NC_groundwater_1537_Pr4_S-0.65um_50_18]